MFVLDVHSKIGKTQKEILKPDKSFKSYVLNRGAIRPVCPKESRMMRFGRTIFKKLRLRRAIF